jgi:hypothetical protein
MQCLQIKLFINIIVMSLFDKVYHWMALYDRKDLLTHNLKVVGSNPTPATTLVELTKA